MHRPTNTPATRRPGGGCTMPARLSRRGGVFLLIGGQAAWLLVFFAAAALGGCAVGRTLDGDAAMVGVTVDGINSVGEQAGEIGGLIGSVFGPGGAAIGTGIGGLIALMFQQARARKQADSAWDEATREAERRALLYRATGASGPGAGDPVRGVGLSTEDS